MKETPMMEQFRKIKEQYPDAMLLFRCGDFYETYAEDAVRAAKVLGITLTHRNNSGNSAAPIEMAGFPFHALDTYLPKLVRAGMRVAICDQLEDPKMTKKLVKRGVTELVTPGLSYSDTTLSARENNFIAAVSFGKGKEANVGLSFLDLSTGEFLAAEGTTDYVDKLLNSFAPKEVLFMRGMKDEFEACFGTKFFTFALEDWMMTYQSAMDRLTQQFQVQNLKGFGLQDMPLGITAAGSILYYLDQTQHLQTAHIHHLSRIEKDRYMWLDRFTIRNLELVSGPHEESRSLCSVLDRTLTPMGGRMLRRWIMLPLKEVRPIRNRQQVVEFFFRYPEKRDIVQQQLARIQDLERIVSKISTGRISPREMQQLATALDACQPIRQVLEPMTDTPYVHSLAQQLTLCPEVVQRIRETIVPEPALAVGKGIVIANGFCHELDELRELQHGGKQYLLDMQQREIERTGIQSLKIGFNNVFGYYLEVRNTYKESVPKEWIRKQTLVNAERYITDELKEYEEKIMSADSQIESLEMRLYLELQCYLTDYVAVLQQNAHILAQLDCLLSFACVAADYHYVCPVLDESLTIDIHQGRHPVIERQMQMGEQYVPNDILLDNNDQQIIILTGPNMAGKSALLRQTALIVLMAQIGSFVPADSAQIGVVDKIFTRVGASDNISMGESTFMVEMNEASCILNNLSERSLVLFDELGRGTSTYDGISIAWAIVEYIHTNACRAKTLFATHYHELNEMEHNFARIRNYNVSVREVDGKVIFLRKLSRGGSEHSFGIHVAKLAGMPPSIVERANHILSDLEKNSSSVGASEDKDTTKGQTPRPTIGQGKAIISAPEGMQLSFFQLDDPVLSQIRDELQQLDINSLTPLDALNRLSEIRKLVGGK